ncbi:MAG: DUF4221 family protein [Cytophagia bacterium]|nr:DUF4221 family protein [Cytophagia bacterium]
MKIQKSLVISLIILATTNCEKKPQQKQTALLAKSEIVLDHLDNIFSNFSLSTKKSGKDSIIVYDAKTDRFGFFNLQEQRLTGFIPIEREGPNFMDFPLIDFEFRNNQLFVLSDAYFSIFDSNGKLIRRYTNADFDDLFSDQRISDFEFLNPHQIVFIHTHMDFVYGKANSIKEDYTLFSILDLSNRSFETLDFEMPEELTNSSEEGYIQDYIFPTFEIVEKKAIYSFPFSADIYVADLSNQSISIQTPEISLINTARDKVNKDIFGSSDWIPYVYSSVKYSELAYDPESKNFAQVANDFTRDSSGNPKNTKYLFVYDESLNLLSEEEIEERIMEPAIFTNHKILLQKSMSVQTTEEGTEFIKYTIKAPGKP